MRTPLRPVSLLAAALLAAVACDGSATDPQTFQPEGCYALTLGAWQGHPEEVMPLPERVQLLSELGTQVLEKDRRLVRPVPNDAPRNYLWSWWEPVAADSISIVWSTGFTGITMRLGQASDGYRGRAENFLDYAWETARADVTLQRQACS